MSSKVAASVMRLPSTICTSSPVFLAKAVADFPPPCTNILGPLMDENTVRNDVSACGLSMTFPPILTILRVFFLSIFKNFFQHQLRRIRSIVRLCNHHGLLTVQHRIFYHYISSYRQAMHKFGCA